MSFEEQAVLMQNSYYKCRQRYYRKEFRWLLMALSKKNPDYYNKMRAYILVIMEIAENALLRGELKRGLQYIICFKVVISKLEKRMHEECIMYWKDIYLN